MNYSRESENCSDSRSKRQQILDAAYEVFSHKGYHQATVDEIIGLADTGKGTVYNYFVNKEQLFYTLIKERSAPFEVEIEKIVSSPLEPLAKFEKIVKAFLVFYTINADLWRVMMHEVRGLGSAGYSSFTEGERDKYREWFRQNIGMLGKVIQEGIAANVIRECEINMAAYSLFSVIVTMVFQKFLREDIDADAHMITDFFLHGLSRK